MKSSPPFRRNSAMLAHFRKCGLGIFVCLSLTSAAPIGYAQSRAPESPSAFEAADRAYTEIAAKKYTAAIADFRIALAADPANAGWRKDLGFACLSAGLPEEAATEFQEIYDLHPEDFALALQLGYIFQQLNRIEGAKKYFETAVQSADRNLSGQAAQALTDLESSQLRDAKQTGYDLLKQHRTREAIEVFEGVHNQDPSDAIVTLQLGYLYASADRASDAEVMFSAVAKNTDPDLSARANVELDRVRRDLKFWFASFYAEPFYQSRYSNEINPVDAKVGLNVSRYFQPYLGLRFTRDVRSVAGTLPQIFSDNSAIFSFGVQSAIAHTGAVFYAEAGTAVNLIGQKPQAPSDYRVGVDWYRSWGAPLSFSGYANHAFSWVGSAYADGGFYSRYNHNLIGNVQIREGINLPVSRTFPMQLLAAVNLLRDKNGDFYNNVVEVGPTLRVVPLRNVPSLSLEAQYQRGFYTIHDPSNPYGARYGDFRIFLIWAKTF